MAAASILRRATRSTLAAAVLLVLAEAAVRVAKVERRLLGAGVAVQFQPPRPTGGPSLASYGEPPRRDGRTLARVARITIPDPLLGWRLVPDAIWEQRGFVIVTNSLGLRDREVAVPKPAGEIRLLCVGDSHAFGWGLNESDMWTTLLERRLLASSAGRRFRVVNGSNYGYTTTQGVALLEQGTLLALDPDVAILVFGLNDAAPRGRLPPRLLRRSALVRCLGLWAGRGPRDDDQARHRRYLTYRGNLTRMIALLRRRGIEPLVVGEALASREGAPWLADLPAFATLARQVAEAEGVPFVDLAAAFARVTRVEGHPAHGPEPASTYFLDATHPTAAGSDLVAGALYERLAQTHLRSPHQESSP